MIDDDESIDIGLISLDASEEDLYSEINPVTPTSPFASSSPNLNGRLPNRTVNRIVSLTRSQTLPRTSLQSSPSRRTASVVFSHADAPLLDSGTVEKLRRWVLCIVSVVFDLEEGPVIETVYPPYSLSEAENSNICFLSLPDANRIDSEVQVHSFRIREANTNGIEEPSRGKSPDGFIYGFSCFSRTKDASFSRGYEQRATVILTHYAWPALFAELARHIGSMRLVHGLPVLESACHSIANWPDPVPGKTLELGIFGNVWNIELPMSTGQKQIGETSFFPGTAMPADKRASPTFPVIRLLGTALPHLWSMWECLVLNKPLLVLGTNPTATSQVIWWLLSLLGPIPFAGDFRPYFTVHDKDFTSLVNRLPPRTGSIIGITNPLVATTCKHWPEMLTLTENQANRVFTSGKSSFGTPLGWQTKTHNRHISKDKTLLKRFEELMKSSTNLKGQVDEELSLSLRQHFVGRALAFLSPLSRHLNMSTTSPNGKQLTKGFNRVEFLKSVENETLPLPFRSRKKRRDFYEQWTNSPSFGLWIARQDEMMNNRA